MLPEIWKMTDLERARMEGISITELHRRREAWTDTTVGPAADAYRKALAKALIVKINPVTGLPERPAPTPPE